jgi:hypothetical protein
VPAFDVPTVVSDDALVRAASCIEVGHSSVVPAVSDRTPEIFVFAVTVTFALGEVGACGFGAAGTDGPDGDFAAAAAIGDIPESPKEPPAAAEAVPEAPNVYIAVSNASPPMKRLRLFLDSTFATAGSPLLKVFSSR